MTNPIDLAPCPSCGAMLRHGCEEGRTHLTRVLDAVRADNRDLYYDLASAVEGEVPEDAFDAAERIVDEYAPNEDVDDVVAAMASQVSHRGR